MPKAELPWLHVMLIVCVLHLLVVLLKYPLRRYLKDGPDDMVVVLAFDDYNSVPAAKSMTQHKRKQRVVDVLPFTEADDVPTGACPAAWDGAMCNR